MHHLFFLILKCCLCYLYLMSITLELPAYVYHLVGCVTELFGFIIAINLNIKYLCSYFVDFNFCIIKYFKTSSSLD